jgi:hypothetical protein
MRQLAHVFGGGEAYGASLRLIGREALAEAPISDRYALLRALYAQNGLYAGTAQYLKDEGLWMPSLKAIGNPTNQVVEFYAAVLPGPDMVIQSDNLNLAEPIRKLWKWSNFDALRVVLARENAMLGDSFVKVVQNDARTRVYFQMIDPEYVVDFDVDARGNVVWIRIDVPRQRRLANGTLEPYTEIEVWSKAEQSYRLWEYDQRNGPVYSLDDDLARLKQPKVEMPLAAFGIDFVPFVHIPFRRVPGEARGQAAVWPSIEKIVNLDLILTALHQNYFAYDRPTTTLESPSVTSSGLGAPPPMIKQGNIDDGQTNVINWGRDKLFRLPSGWTIKHTVPDINFAAGLAIVQDYWTMLVRERAELIWSMLAELGSNTSGVALKTMAAKAEAMGREARANWEQGVVRADMMGLTMMVGARLAEASIGSFDSPDPATSFDHAFEERPILPVVEMDEAQAELAKAQGFAAWVAAGLPFVEAAQRAGYTEEEAAGLALLAAADVERNTVATQSEDDGREEADRR